MGSCNDNGCLLLELCAEQQLSITNTIFQQKDSLKTTWMHPRSKHWHLIDYILVRQRDLKDVFHTRVMPSAECHTNHRLVLCKITFHFNPKPRKGGAPRKKLKVCSLQSAAVRAVFQESLQSRLEEPFCLADSPPALEVLWDRIKTVVLQISEDTLGFTTKQNRDWFNENNLEVQELLSKKRSAHKAHLAQPSCPHKKEAFHLECSKCCFFHSKSSIWSLIPNPEPPAECRRKITAHRKGLYSEPLV